jgi:ADP-ribosylglycohydrolase
MACITGGIAQAYYRKIPENIVADVTNRLSPDLREVLDEFNTKYRCPF